MKVQRILSLVLLIIASTEWVAAEVTITQQPTNAVVSLGVTVQFHVLVNSTAPPITYQWRFANSALDPTMNPSAATSRLWLTNVALADAGPYDVIVSDGSGSVTSQTATLTVDPTFTKITQSPVATDLESSEAPIWWDYDNDGLIDLFVPNSRGPDNPVRSSLYHNDGNGNFMKATNDITRVTRNALNAAVGDYNNDGFDDLLVVRPNGADDLYQNLGDGSFARLEAAQVGPPVGDVDYSMDAGWADYDRDGFLDLFVANAYFAAGDDHLYHNTGNGSFIKMKSSEVGVLVVDNLLTGPCAWVDYDNDGFPDLWVGTSVTQANPSGRQFLYHNNEGRGFSQVSAGSLTNNLARGIGQWADYDNDGYLDLFLTSWTGAISLHRNLGGLTFTDVSMAAGVDTAMRQTWAAAWGDYDNDGFLDLIVLSDSTLSALYNNNGDGTFTSVDVGSPLRDGSGTVHAGVAWADYDNDGSLDLVVTCGDGLPNRNALYRNNGNSNNWLKIKLTGTASNRSAIGAKVRVTTAIAGKQVRQTREISGNSGCSGGAGGLVAHFGLGDATNVDLVRIEWPSGNVQELIGVPPNQALTIQETVSITPPMPSVSLNGSVRLLSSLSGTYQWRFNGTAIANATGRSLTLEGVQANQAGRYSVVVTGADQGVVTNHVYLRVDPTFTKITQGAPATDMEGSTSATWVDYDQDGYLDLFVGNWGANARNSLYLNNRDGSFSKTSGLATATVGAWGVTWGDYDNDGYPDLFVARPGTLNDALFHNQGNGQFSRITTGPLVLDGLESIMPFWGDANNDGLIDLFLATGLYSELQNDRLYFNQGGGVFKIATPSDVGEIVRDRARTLGLGWVDYDNDRDLDLFVAYTELFTDITSDRFVPATNFVFRSSLTGLFEKIALPTLDIAGQCWGVAWGDYDNDGYLDVFLPSSFGTNALFRNLQGQGFSDVAEPAGLRVAISSWASAWGDYDNDGWLDLFVANYSAGARYPGGNALFRNNHDGTFTRVTGGSLAYEGGLAVGAAWGDYDNDGFLDLYVTNGDSVPERNLFYRNNGNGNGWLKVQLRGTASNRLGLGAKVRLLAKVGGKDLWQMRPISGQHSHVSDNGLIAHFGLGDATNVTKLTIEWPSGVTQELANVAPRQFLTVWEPPAIKAAVGENGASLLTITAEPNQAWRIEGSADLEKWDLLGKVTNTTATVTYTDPASATMVCRFYRVVAD